MVYNNYHLFADSDPKTLPRFPIDVKFRDSTKAIQIHKCDERTRRLSDVITRWNETEEHKALSACLHKMKDTAPITKIFCSYFN